MSRPSRQSWLRYPSIVAKIKIEVRGRRVLCKACANECLVSLNKSSQWRRRYTGKKAWCDNLKVFGEKAELVSKLPKTKNIFTRQARWKGDFVLKEDVAALHDVSWEKFMEEGVSRQAAWSELCLLFSDKIADLRS